MSVTIGPWVAFAAAALLATGVGEARAHSFDIGFVAPLSGPEAGRGKQALDGFLLATRERDGHALEESDGHLGGLDSHVVRIDSGRGAEAVRGRLEELLRGEGVAFVTAPSVSATLAAAGIVEGDRGIRVEVVDSAAYRSAVRAPEDLVTMDGVLFKAVFREAYGYEADLDAIAGYLAARIIGAAVAAVAGEFSRRDALERALARARRDLP